MAQESRRLSTDATPHSTALRRAFFPDGDVFQGVAPGRAVRSSTDYSISSTPVSGKTSRLSGTTAISVLSPGLSRATTVSGIDPVRPKSVHLRPSSGLSFRHGYGDAPAYPLGSLDSRVEPTAENFFSNRGYDIESQRVQDPQPEQTDSSVTGAGRFPLSPVTAIVAAAAVGTAVASVILVKLKEWPEINVLILITETLTTSLALCFILVDHCRKRRSLRGKGMTLFYILLGCGFLAEAVAWILWWVTDNGEHSVRDYSYYAILAGNLLASVAVAHHTDLVSHLRHSL